MKFHIFIGLAIIAASSARVVREVPETESHFQLENFMERVDTGLKEMEKIALEAAGAADTDELKQRAREHFDIIAKHFSLFTENIKQETDKLKENEMVKELRETVDKHIGDFRDHADQRIAKFKEEHPETYNQVASHIDTLKTASSAIANKIDGLANSEDAQHLKEASIKFIDDIKETFIDLGKEVKADGEQKA